MLVLAIALCVAMRRDKIRFDEKTLNPIGIGSVSRPYPYPYGFVVATTAADGDNVDCYVVRNGDLKFGSIVECEPIGLLEQEETGQPDHKVLAVVAGEAEAIPEGALEVLQNFIYGVFSDYPEDTVRVGPIHSRNAALRYIRECQDA